MFRFPPRSRLIVGATACVAVAGLAACGSSKAAVPATTVKPVATTVKAAPSTVKAATTVAAATTVKPATTATTVTPAATGTTAVAPAKVNANTAADADLLKVPGMSSQILASIKAGRPYANAAALHTALGKTTLTPAQVTALESHLTV